MKITYDKSIDAAYIYLVEKPLKVNSTYSCDPSEINGEINLDFDSMGKLIGIEILNASNKLNNEILKISEKLWTGLNIKWKGN